MKVTRPTVDSFLNQHNFLFWFYTKLRDTTLLHRNPSGLKCPLKKKSLPVLIAYLLSILNVFQKTTGVPHNLITAFLSISFISVAPLLSWKHLNLCTSSFSSFDLASGSKLYSDITLIFFCFVNVRLRLWGALC